MEHSSGSQLPLLVATIGGVAIAAFVCGRMTAPHAAHSEPEPSKAEPLTTPATDEEDSDEDSDAVPADIELKMVICVRSDLGMSKGKVAAQVGHAVLSCYRTARRQNPEWTKAWLHRAQGKIALKVNDEAHMNAVADAAKAAGLPFCVIEDAGRTEVEPGTHTVCGIGPAPKALIDLITGPRGSIPLRLLT